LGTPIKNNIAKRDKKVKRYKSIEISGRVGGREENTSSGIPLQGLLSVEEVSSVKVGDLSGELNSDSESHNKYFNISSSSPIFELEMESVIF